MADAASRRRLGDLAAAALVALAAGCGGGPDPVAARVADLELAVARLDRRLDALAGAAPVAAVVSAAPAGPDADLAARLAALEAQVALLERALRATEEGAPARPVEARGAGPRRLAAGPPPAAPPRVTVIDAPGAAGRAPPPAGATVEVLSAGSGDALLVRGPAGLERLALAGVEAPLPAEAYARDPVARARHAERLGPAAVASDVAFDRSRARLEALVAAGRATLSYPPGGPARREGALVARVTVPGDAGPRDLAELLVGEGWALAGEGDPERAEVLAALEAEARLARRGLFAD